jgi:septum formation inhibitor MinC
MNYTKQPKIELLPSRDSVLRAGVDDKTLTLLVKEKVAEIMADRDAMVFEPFFRSRQVAYELKRLQSVPEQQKWSVHFGRFGCLICQTRKRIYVGNGMCNTCYGKTFNALKQIIGEGVNRAPLISSREAQESTPGMRELLPVKSLAKRSRRTKKRRKTSAKSKRPLQNKTSVLDLS